MSKFSEQVPRSNQQVRFLPLFHTCDGFAARGYIKSGSIKTEDVCEVFDKKITYLFYGRPAYKYSIQEKSTTQLSIYPVCFVFDLDLVDNIEAVYPFDTGALYHHALDGFVNRKNVVADFELEPKAERISDIILKFYGDNENYLKSKIVDRDIDPLDFEAVAFAEMNKSYASHGADERRVTIEVQAGEEVPFAGGRLRAVIAPVQYLDSPLFQAFASDQKIDVRTYQILVWNPLLSFGVVADAANRYMIERGYLAR